MTSYTRMESSARMHPRDRDDRWLGLDDILDRDGILGSDAPSDRDDLRLE